MPVVLAGIPGYVATPVYRVPPAHSGTLLEQIVEKLSASATAKRPVSGRFDEITTRIAVRGAPAASLPATRLRERMKRTDQGCCGNDCAGKQTQVSRGARPRKQSVKAIGIKSR